MVLVYYGDQKDKKPVFDRVFEKLGLEKKDLSDADLDKTMKELVSGPHEYMEAADSAGPIFMYYDGHGSKDVQNVADALEKEGIKVTHRAVRTENNESWTLGHIMKEIALEDEWYKLSAKLYQLITHPDKERLKSDPQYMMLMSSAFALFEGQNASLEDLKAAIAAIEKAGR